MPKLIKDGAITDDPWLAPGSEQEPGRLCSLAQWEALNDKRESAVQIEPGESLEPLFPHLGEIALIAINFPVFTDGRGFSYARELRERGYAGELRAVGHFIRDQMTYLSRVGFNAFQMSEETNLESALDSLADFSEHYQASSDEALPLFRRRQGN